MPEEERIDLKTGVFYEIQSRWFSPLQMLELDACSRCQECVSVCPVIRAGYSNSMMERIESWRKITSRSSGFLTRLTGANSPYPDISTLFPDLYRCTSCDACSVVCEAGIDIMSLCESMRGLSREIGYRDADIERIAEKIMKTKNPYDVTHEKQDTWIHKGIQIADSAPIGLFMGCSISVRDQAVGRASLRILARSNTEFCMLQSRESCCGSFLFRTGSYNGYQETILTMIQDFQERGVETLLILCAGCLKTISLDWPRIYGMELPFRIVPFYIFVRDLIRTQQIRFNSSQPLQVVYHDPCHLGRHLMHHLGKEWVFESPREILSAIPGLKLVDFLENREFQACCGAGGGLKAREPDLAGIIAQEKIVQAQGLGADILITTCPFCTRNLKDASAATGSFIEVIDLIEFVDRMMNPYP